MSTNGTPQPFPAVTETVEWDGPILAGPAPKKRRGRKVKGDLKRWEVHHPAGIIMRLSARDHTEAVEIAMRTVPVPHRSRCIVKEAK